MMSSVFRGTGILPAMASRLAVWKSRWDACSPVRTAGEGGDYPSLVSLSRWPRSGGADYVRPVAGAVAGASWGK